jgi:3-oxoacyl-[acyl-carrier protein] reductase
VTDMNLLANRIALVTGASKGIGAGIAKAFAAAGAAVVVNYAANREAADRTVEAITEAGGRAVAIQADVSKAEQVRRLFEAAEVTFGVPDIIVNNAGVFSFGPIDTVTEAEIERQDVARIAVFLASDAAAFITGERIMASGGWR